MSDVVFVVSGLGFAGPAIGPAVPGPRVGAILIVLGLTVFPTLALAPTLERLPPSAGPAVLSN